MRNLLRDLQYDLGVASFEAVIEGTRIRHHRQGGHRGAFRIQDRRGNAWKARHDRAATRAQARTADFLQNIEDLVERRAIPGIFRQRGL